MTRLDSRSLRLHHADLDFFVDVTIHERDGRFMATAALGEDSHDIGTDDTPREALRAALAPLGDEYVDEMAGDAVS